MLKLTVLVYLFSWCEGYRFNLTNFGVIVMKSSLITVL